jgi:hypothetical protein
MGCCKAAFFILQRLHQNVCMGFWLFVSKKNKKANKYQFFGYSMALPLFSKLIAAIWKIIAGCWSMLPIPLSLTKPIFNP